MSGEQCTGPTKWFPSLRGLGILSPGEGMTGGGRGEGGGGRRGRGEGGGGRRGRGEGEGINILVSAFY